MNTFFVDRAGTDRDFCRHECDDDAQNPLVLEEGSGRVPRADGSGAGGISAGFGVVA
jgi:hypothetical protein